jgi:acetyl esterase/lipase
MLSPATRQWWYVFSADIPDSSMTCLPLCILRQKASIDHYKGSTRYGNILPTLNDRIECADFAGNWLCKPDFQNTKAPREADVVILYIHGGGYVMMQPNQFSTMLLRVAETVSEAGKTVAIFVLDYSLAPEYVFPRQLRQTVACWDYLTTEQNISPSKIALMGDSAGGSICLSFLAHVARPLPSVKSPTMCRKPGLGLFLISPWVSLFDESGYAGNADSDLLDASALRRWATWLVNGTSAEVIRTYLEFSTSNPEGPGLEQILPTNVRVFAGGDEIFLQNISRFCSTAQAAGTEVRIWVEPGEPHDWQVAQALKNEKKYLSLPRGTPDDGLLSGADAIGKALVALL